MSTDESPRRGHMIQTRDRSATFFTEPDWQYHRWSGVYMTSHLLIAAHESINEWRNRMLHPRLDTQVFAFGRLAHVLLMEPETFEDQYIVGGPVNPRTRKTFGEESQKFQAWAVEQKKHAVRTESVELAKRMAASVQRHKAAGKLLSAGLPEQVARESYCDLPCQIRIDWLTADKWIVDYKSTSDISSFSASIEEYGYTTQAAFYQAIAKIVTGEQLPYYLIACEKSDAATCVVWQLKQAKLDEHRARNEAKLREIRSEFLAINERRPDLSVMEQSVEEFRFHSERAIA